MTVFEGIRIGIQIMLLDVWLIWVIFIIADMIISHKWLKQSDKDINSTMALMRAFTEYQKATEERYKEVLRKLKEKEK